MAITVLGFLSPVGIPKFVVLVDKVNRAACDTSVGAINAAILKQYVLQLAGPKPDTRWMDDIDSMDKVEPSWFADGEVPTCPFGGPYEIQNGVCQKHSH